MDRYPRLAEALRQKGALRPDGGLNRQVTADEAERYAFLYPREWLLVRDGQELRVARTDPGDGSLDVLLLHREDLGRFDRLEDALGRLVEQRVAGNPKLRMTSWELGYRVDGQPSLSVLLEEGKKGAGTVASERWNITGDARGMMGFGFGAGPEGQDSLLPLYDHLLMNLVWLNPGPKE